MFLLALTAALADTGAVSGAAPRACGADSLFTPVPVYVRVTVVNRADTAAATSLLLIGEAVAARIRTALAGSPDVLPRGDSLVVRPRRDGATAALWVGGIDSAGVRVVARRDGTLHWTPVHSPESPAAAVLGRALAEAQQHDETFIMPESFTADSMPFTLGYVRKSDVVRGRVVARPAGPATLVAFTLRTAVEKQAAAVPGTLRATYPEGARMGHAEGLLALQFVVDTSGRADVTTVHDVWPADRPRLTGELRRHYDAFLEASVDGIRRARFYPAEIAGCKVKQLVQLPFSFSLAR